MRHRRDRFFDYCYFAVASCEPADNYKCTLQIRSIAGRGGTQITSALFFVYLSVFVNTRRHQNQEREKGGGGTQ